ncbi:NAD(P)H-nitrite reductase [Agrobacterium vitis]|uniref:NAD(P)/FAD-dependent oxidoreductase n=1 Tax=Rhizobium/Agrobacterium group TaxID=227290 RepID=UPI0012E753C9|nr:MULTISPECIES: FAD-dependent oxidoreductase [Rhizobium/Agrobacterium group]MCF1495732.1 NAD(P)H-nitrite reductase [Allorhizobium ampelinum]MVA45833.1 NAD(P)H-nitrite reductase [Agrobacterium vitis]
MSGILILGASHSGVAAAAALRTGGHRDAITVLTHESVQPYHRPPLSKEGLTKDAYTPTPLRPESFYQNSRIDLKQGVRIIGLDRAEKYLLADDGTRYPYETLILACGAEPRRLPPAVDPGKIAHYLRTHDDLIQLKSRLAGARSIVVIGGGLIGVEIAALAVQKGLHTTLIELGTRLMERTVSKSIANYVLDRHEANGLKARFGVTVTAIGHHGDSGVDVVTFADGETIEADLVVVAIGAVAHDALARDAGLEVENGVLCTAVGLTSDPAIRAIGDCAAWYDPVLERHVRNEAVNPGQDQARIVAAAILGTDMPPRRLPRFWSHQAAIQIQMAGDVHGSDMEAVLKAPASGAFSVLGFKGGDLVAVQTINAPQQFGKLHDMIGMDREALTVALDVEFPPPHHY